MYDYIIVGGGIIGLSCAMQLSQQYPQANILLLEKEAKLASHQTGHNSGVIHAGVYYKPGSLKAKFCKAGQTTMVDFCQQHDIPYDICGKTIVALNAQETERLNALFERASKNGVPVKKISLDQLKELEPNVQAVAALHVETTGIVDYVTVSKKYAELFQKAGGDIKLNTRVLKTTETKTNVIVHTDQGDYTSQHLIACAGLQCDRLAKKSKLDIDCKIVPFRGEYFDIVSDKKSLINNLIYPVPNPKFPFLGVHFTRHIDGRMSVGPNAVLNLSREGYKKFQLNIKDLCDVLGFKGFWKMTGQYLIPGSNEMLHSLCKTLYMRQVKKYFPQLDSKDLKPAPCGIRAQALNSKGELLDDFKLIAGPHQRSIHVCNAPSPAATSSLPIGKFILEKLEP